MEEFNWAGIPFKNRYSEFVKPNSLALLKDIKKYDRMLDLKFYLPTESWHLVRYTGSQPEGKFTRVWALEDNPELGLRKEPGRWMLDALKKADMWGAARNRVEEVDATNKGIEAAVKSEVHDQCRELSKDLLKPLQNLHDYGPNSDTHLNYPVAG